MYICLLSSQVYYNGVLKLVRYDYKNMANTPPTYTQNPLSEVHDYSAGNVLPFYPVSHLQKSLSEHKYLKHIFFTT